MIRGVLFDKDGTLLEFDTLWGGGNKTGTAVLFTGFVCSGEASFI